jgi:hypothetical protein
MAGVDDCLERRLRQRRRQILRITRCQHAVLVAVHDETRHTYAVQPLPQPWIMRIGAPAEVECALPILRHGYKLQLRH